MSDSMFALYDSIEAEYERSGNLSFLDYLKQRYPDLYAELYSDDPEACLGW